MYISMSVLLNKNKSNQTYLVDRDKPGIRILNYGVSTHFLPVAVQLFLLSGVIKSHCYSLSFLVRGLLHS